MSTEPNKGSCFFAQFSKKPCKGIIDAHHIIHKQNLKYADGDQEALMSDMRNIVPACRQHHDDWHHYAFEMPREAVPESTEEFARELGLGWALDRRFGPRPQPPSEGQTNVYEAIHRAEGVRDED